MTQIVEQCTSLWQWKSVCLAEQFKYIFNPLIGAASLKGKLYKAVSEKSAQSTEP